MLTLVALLLIALGIQLVLFIPAYFFRTDKLTDLGYALTFITLTVIAFITTDQSPPKIILLTLISIWGARLALYLFIRVLHVGKDARFDGIRDHPLAFLSFWCMQGLLAWVVLLPSFWFFDSVAQLTTLSGIGLVIWVIGFCIESVADAQKFSFKNKHPQKWIASGLWKYSRHPNFFGEALCWIGIYLYVLPTILPFWLIALVSPITIISLLVFVTGIPPLEERYDKKFGDDEEYQEYKEKTSVFVPLPPKN